MIHQRTTHTIWYLLITASCLLTACATEPTLLAALLDGTQRAATKLSLPASTQVTVVNDTEPFTASPMAHVTVVIDGLIGPVGLAALPDGTLLIAEEGTGEDDESAGVTALHPTGASGRLITGLPSSRDAGDLAGVNLVHVAPDGQTIYIGNFGQGWLWTYELPVDPLVLSDPPLTTDALGQTLLPRNNVRLLNPFDMTHSADGRLIVTDASGNGVATTYPDGTVRFFHRFDLLPNPERSTDPIEAVPTGITRIGNEYYVTLFGGCPYPAASGQLVAIDETRNQRTIVDGLNLPIDVAVGPDGTIWLLEFATFTPGASCFDGSGYKAGTGRLSRVVDGRLEPVLTGLNHPGAVLPMPDGTLYLTEVLEGRLLHVTVAADHEIIQGENDAIIETTEEAGSLQFTDVAAAVGLTFRHGAFQQAVSMDPVAAMGAGLCWIDYDKDGWLDLYLVNSYALDEQAYWHNQGGLPRNELYRNVGGTFVAVGDQAGVAVSMRGNGCVAADLNLDGWHDLFVTADGPDLLFWNNGDGTFTEGATAAGVAAPEWNSAAVVGDLNNDTLPDLFVAAYIDLNKMVPKPSGAFPQDFYGLPDRLYLNQGVDPTTGHASFREVTVAAGLSREERGLGALLTDVDADGDLDLYIANDGHPNRLHSNVPWPGGLAADPEGLGFRFEDVTAAADVGDSGSGMGVTGGDYDGDARVDLLITNWDRELNALYANRTEVPGALDFQYSTFRMGMAGFGAGLTGWGVQMADFDHDGDDDFLVANGHVPITDFASDAQFVRFYRNRTQELLANPSQRPGQPLLFVDGTEATGLLEVGPLMARGSAAADYDNDGDLDVAINTVGRQVVLLANNAADAQLGNWLQVTVVDAQPGTQLEVTLPDGRQLRRELYVGSSYLASEDPRLHIGLGTVETATQLIVRWPDGTTRVLANIQVNQELRVARP